MPYKAIAWRIYWKSLFWNSHADLVSDVIGNVIWCRAARKQINVCKSGEKKNWLFGVGRVFTAELFHLCAVKTPRLHTLHGYFHRVNKRRTTWRGSRTSFHPRLAEKIAGEWKRPKRGYIVCSCHVSTVCVCVWVWVCVWERRMADRLTCCVHATIMIRKWPQLFCSFSICHPVAFLFIFLCVSMFWGLLQQMYRRRSQWINS